MISGLQKMTLLDFPGKVACTVFLAGCNFRCPFCHNSDLLPAATEAYMDLPTFFAFLEKRKGLLDAVCITGGEPTLSPDLEPLLRGIKERGFAAKLDTNGTRPAVLKRLVAEGLLDYVAMDIKNSPARYGETVGVPGLKLDAVTESLQFLLTDAVPYELRTTVVAELHSEDSIREMGEWLAEVSAPRRPQNLYLQCFTDRESVLQSGLTAPTTETLVQYAEILRPYVGHISLRGV